MPGVVRFKVNGQEVLAIELDRFKQRMNDASPLFDAIADRMAQVWGREFRLQGAWVRWAPLSPKYREWKAEHYPGAKILHLSGDLESSMTRRPFGIDIISEKTMTIGTQVPYAGYHQRGTPSMPARPIIRPIKPADLKLIGKMMHEYVVTGKVTTRGRN